MMSSSYIRVEPKLTVAMLFSGMALLISIFTGTSLALSLVLLGITALIIVIAKWRQTPFEIRPLIRRQFITGLVAGISATLVYDIVRWMLTTFGLFNFYPFETFNIFGQLIVGEAAPRSLTVPIGTAYHFLNGIAFATAYCFFAGGRNWKFGIAWALVLEAAMLSIYPGWLDLQAVMREFVAVSMLGHIAYGITLGVISQRRLSQFRISRENMANANQDNSVA